MRFTFARSAASALAGLLALSTAAQAETPMTAQEFETYATGKTLTYAYEGTVFGTEQYLPNRRVRWAYTQDECKNGYWYGQDDMICFVYDDQPEHQCWAFYARPTGIAALFLNDPANTQLSEVENTDSPLACPGPDIGA